ncbi:MAG: signal recognition particle-docking protein FtsY [Planctomycetota bacterium]|jgi:fused signal recognition particle receptor|nr:MAG: signal recognition particle-docking protein FtsY [Planctomycetota bacterium]
MLGAIWQKLKTGLARTRDLFTGVAGLFRLKGRVDEAFLAELEKRLLSADMGALVSRDLVAQVRQSFLDREITGDVEAHVRQHLRSLLGDDDRSFHLAESGPTVILIAGVNGSGKTTSIAKLANRFHKEGKKVLVAACDTFRAAAVEQLALWAQRTGVEIVKGQTGADPASVAHDACVKAQAKGFDILIVDTAGRLHTQTHLMRELEKIQRILAKQIPGAPHEAIMILDATNGQNAIAQAQEFQKVINSTGLIVTKLDGTAKGGSVFAIKQKLQLPVKLIGVGEGMDDLEPFDPDAFVAALFE